ncbi:neutral zinc metallopeptidase [Tsukamurella sp. 8F]|uniref:KPN_02809 family neutral zinc metallopeptidase n=1 Tax=unclassified Tsukamurella TaxID=2633480 RepID=UPI0023B9519B|nr:MULTISPECIES: neutral zinc metallopeptidase [unclassified Tsukamurella]MDF0529168.1 neutral zinc metallopeptidase [Tsukamurella sp. 8J]MDF0585353.1 neutral zinc metallopeptidase [Tsukamurella sp. 8F]
MTFRDDGDISGGDVSAGGSGGGGGGFGGFGGGGGGFPTGAILGGGGIGTVVIALIIWGASSFLGGGSPSGSGQQVGSGAGSAGQQQLQQQLDACKTGADANKSTACRIKATTVSLNTVWPQLLKGYTKPVGTVIMPSGAQSVNTACGVASADTGPFYCPADKKAYFQLDFMDKVIGQMGGSNKPFSQEYIVAHEFGHHVQNLLGDIKKSQQSAQGAESGSVRVELQADCYAGVWAAHADKGANPLLKPLTKGDIQEAIQTAKAIGDDTIQTNAGRNVNPESWTHGSSAERVKWFSTGYQSGDPNKCDTFSGSI